MNAKQCKKLRRQAREFATEQLPVRKTIGGTHRFSLTDEVIDGEKRKVLRFHPSQAVNERMTRRGIYRLLKRDERSGA